MTNSVLCRIHPKLYDLIREIQKEYEEKYRIKLTTKQASYLLFKKINFKTLDIPELILD